MKKILVIAAVSLAATSAFASKARLTALGSAAHLDDAQNIFLNPAQISVLGEWATFEFGSNAYDYTAGTANPSNVSGNEGGFVRTSGDAYYGAYLGHKDAGQLLLRAVSNAFTAQDVLNEENPIELIYGTKVGDLTYAGSLVYSNSDKKNTKQKQSTTGVRLGAKASTWDAYVNIGLVGTGKNDTTASSETDFKSTLSYALGGSYTLDSLYIFGTTSAAKSKTTVGTTDSSDLEYTDYSFGVVNSHKKDGHEFFYGVSYLSKTLKNKVGTGTKGELTALPVLIGVEAEAASWLVLRASVTQNVLIGSILDENAGTGTGLLTSATAKAEKDTLNDSTTVAAGAGLKFGKLLVDGTLSAAGNGGYLTTGEGNATKTSNYALLSNVSLTYTF
ncbi:MAG: hypothetical protein ACOYOK_06905 [Pseudobdellovibrionaceae bacterium]